MSRYSCAKVKLEHIGGTKHYHVLTIMDHETNRGIVIRRWGKTATWGQVQQFTGTMKNAERHTTQLLNTKTARGYTANRPETEEFEAGELGLPSILDGYMANRSTRTMIEEFFAGGEAVASASTAAKAKPRAPVVEAPKPAVWGTW